MSEPALNKFMTLRRMFSVGKRPSSDNNDKEEARENSAELADELDRLNADGESEDDDTSDEDEEAEARLAYDNECYTGSLGAGRKYTADGEPIALDTGSKQSHFQSKVTLRRQPNMYSADRTGSVEDAPLLQRNVTKRLDERQGLEDTVTGAIRKAQSDAVEMTNEDAAPKAPSAISKGSFPGSDGGDESGGGGAIGEYDHATGENDNGDAAGSQRNVALFASFSLHGTRHDTLNQDASFCAQVHVGGKKLTIAAVFDGHGILGERSSAAATAELETLCGDPELLNRFLLEPDDAMVALFERLQVRVLASHDDPPDSYVYPGRPGNDPLKFELKEVGGTFGSVYNCTNASMPPAPIDFGTTAALAVTYGTTAVLGSIGDAGIVVCKKNRTYNEDDGKLVSSHHTAGEPSEQERINRDFPDMAHFTQDGYLAPLHDELGQYEVQLTRSLGHKLLRQFGIICTPEVIVLDLDAPGDDQITALVLCSDGVTDELQPRDIAERVANADTPEEACRVLVADAQEYCMDRDKIDDCTAVVLVIE